MPGIADKFTQSAHGRLLSPGMTREKLARSPHINRSIKCGISGMSAGGIG
jgi:hypothetical protein